MTAHCDKNIDVFQSSMVVQKVIDGVVLVVVANSQSFFNLLGREAHAHQLSHCRIIVRCPSSSIRALRRVRTLSLEKQLLLSLKLVRFYVTLGKERYRKLAAIKVKTTLDQVDAALMPLQVIQSKQQVNLVVLKHCETALYRLLAADQEHVGEVDSAEDPRLADSDGHPCKPSVELMEDVALLRTLLAYNRALSSRIDESLNRMSINRGVDVEHGHVTEELGVVFERAFVVSLYHLLANFFLDHFLSLGVIWVGISQPHLTLLLGFLLIHDFFEPVCDDLLDLSVVVTTECIEEDFVAVLQPRFEMHVGEEHLFEFARLLADTHSLSVVDHLIGELLL